MAPITSGFVASPLFLREAEVRRGFDLLHCAYAATVGAMDAMLAQHCLGRADQRALYFIGRQPGLTVGELLAFLGVTKQALNRTLTALEARGLVAGEAGTVDRRQRLLRLTGEGKALEEALFDVMRARLAAAYGGAGQQAVTGFWQVMEGLIPPEQRPRVAALSKNA